MKQIFHLTPRGWFQGAFYSNSHPPEGHTQSPPHDRVLSIECKEDAYAMPQHTHVVYSIVWEINDHALLSECKKRFGALPDCFKNL